LSDIEGPHETRGDIGAFKQNLEASRLRVSVVVKRWHVAFQAFLQNKGKSLDRKGLKAARTLEISQSFCSIYLEISTFDNGILTSEMAWDRFTARYEHIVELASLIVEPNPDGNTQKQRPEFSQDMNTVGPLYAVAHRCRDPVIRRKAVAILYAAPRQEGVWDSMLTARVAEKVISIEEEGLGIVICAADVPDWARINDVSVKFDLHGRLGAISYKHSRSMPEKAREIIMQTIRW